MMLFGLISGSDYYFRALAGTLGTSDGDLFAGFKSNLISLVVSDIISSSVILY